jgi:transmembrane 9 superfamily protein 2/4
MKLFSSLLLLFLVVHNSFAVLPGVAPVEYKDGEPVPLKVNKVDSVHTQLPYKYYSLPFCKPKGGIQDKAENLGEILLGDRIENSDYEVLFLKI